MPSDSKRLFQVSQHIRRIKASSYPQIVDARSGGFSIQERPFSEIPEPNKLAILQTAVDWSGITNRDQAHLLLREVDPGKITEAQRDKLVRMADAPEAKPLAKRKEMEMER